MSRDWMSRDREKMKGTQHGRFGMDSMIKVLCPH